MDAKCRDALRPLTDTKVDVAKAREKTYTITDGGGIDRKVAPTGLKVWRLAYQQKRQAESADVWDIPGAGKRDAKPKDHAWSAHTFEAGAREWLTKAAVEPTESTQRKNTNWLERHIFPAIGAVPIADL